MPMQRAFLVVLPLLPLAAAAQPPAAPQQTFAEEVAVSVVNVEVFVADGKGAPVRGLEREDFEVYEDGRPVEVTNFYAAERSAATTSPEAQDGARPEDQRLHLVVFVDDVHIAPQGRKKILERVREFLGSGLGAGDKVMLVRYARKLEVRRPFTSDLAQVGGDLAVLETVSADLGDRAGTAEEVMAEIEREVEASGGWDATAESLVRTFAEREAGLAAGTLAALDSVVGWLAGVPGRKAVLYVSDGIPAAPGEELLTWVASRVQGSSRISYLNGYAYDLRTKFKSLTMRASRNRVAFYPIEVGTASERAGGLIEQESRINRQNALKLLADDTGGRALVNATDPRRDLERMAVDFSDYYSLGYRPPRAGDGREHAIEVRVKRDGVQVRHRRSYRDKPMAEAAADRTVAAMLFGLEDNPLGASVEVGAPAAMGDVFQVPIRVRIPFAGLYFKPEDTYRTGQIRLFVALSGGEPGPVRETARRLEIPAEDFASGKAKEYVHEVRMKLAPGAYILAVGVRDDLGATASYLRKEFRVGM